MTNDNKYSFSLKCEFYFKIKLAGFFMFILFTIIPASGQELKVESLKINSVSSGEMAPFVHDSVIYFVSNRKSTIFINVFNQDNEHLYRLYKAPLLPGGRIGRVTPFEGLAGSLLTTGPVTISPDGEFMLATLNKSSSLREARSRSGYNQLGLFRLERQASGWENPVPLPLNIEGYSVGQPSLSPDGRQLYFVSNKSGGYGETDIYRSVLSENGWSTPENLGGVINTPGRELFPFFHPSGKLYFSSDGHGGYGGLDIFYSIYENGTWSEPIALESPINSPYDDFSCFIFNDETVGFFASNRDGIDNIYRFEYELVFCERALEVVDDNFCFTLFEDSGLDSDTIPLAFKWTISDGTEAMGAEVDHCFPGPGRYEIYLNVIDSITGEEQYSVANYVLDLELTKQVWFEIPETIKVNEPLNVIAQLNGYGEVGHVEYFWDFGDDQRLRGESVQHVFTRSGTYRIRCEAYWGDNKVCSYRTIVVE
ncbi:PKD domain-containing protein [Natronoflexus pectinivorans]|uniref:PKD domain-containing protein n=2 Tax=Natronoflexus pectinivorans TaxID=682526 RepID=A0A4V2RWX2_9BACT|nr:PKD domain-containing protein [Natronoflexus pectinivorans]